MALVLLVVVGHSWTLLPSNAVVDQLYDFLYAWHVPAFVFVTGYLSRSFAWSSQRMWGLFKGVVVPYLVFELALALFRIYVGGEELEGLFQDPHWPMWYLSALFFWRLLTPVFKPMWGGLVVAVAISIVAGLRAGDTLDMARVLGLLPFFVMGLKATPERLELLRRRPAQIGAVVVMVTIFVLTLWTDTWASTEWLYYRSTYGELDASDTRAFVTRAVLLLVGTLGAWAFLALVPRVRGWFSTMGTWTLVVYLFHGFVVKSFEYSGYPGWADDHAALALLVTTAGAVGLALLLAWGPLARRLDLAVDPFGSAEHRVLHAVELAAVSEEVAAGEAPEVVAAVVKPEAAAAEADQLTR
jgi:fucose 4-O-acetylase-like acetyltransferase